MTDITPAQGDLVAIQKETLDALLGALRAEGYETLGPKVQDAAVVYGSIERLADLPQGYLSEQAAGSYQLKEAGHDKYFSITPGAQSWKQFLFPPRSELFRLTRKNGGWKEESLQGEAPRYAFIGVRNCELWAIRGVLDKVFLREDFQDPIYAKRRENIFIVSVDCMTPGDTCFCVSMGGSPKVEQGFDLNLTELDDVFLVNIGSEKGRKIMEGLPVDMVNTAKMEIARQGWENAEHSMGRELADVKSVPDLLLNNLEHPRWKDVAARCLSCTSCTQVCPTCFCWDVEEDTSLDGKTTMRTRVWDSCFNFAYSAQAGGNTRPSTYSRYRQWLTHKMGSWQQQFGVLGCVGCGRCITWCPAGIDITEEIKAIQEAQPT